MAGNTPREPPPAIAGDPRRTLAVIVPAAGKPRALRRAARFSRPAALAAASLALAACTALPPENPTEPATPPDYGPIVAQALSKYKDFSRFTDFQISGLRWVHAETGWNWLACLRFSDRGQQRTYALFLKGNIVVDGRYDILTDQCAAQQYVPYDITTGTIGRPTPQSPIY